MVVCEEVTYVIMLLLMRFRLSLKVLNKTFKYSYSSTQCMSSALLLTWDEFKQQYLFRSLYLSFDWSWRNSACPFFGDYLIKMERACKRFEDDGRYNVIPSVIFDFQHNIKSKTSHYYSKDGKTSSSPLYSEKIKS